MASQISKFVPCAHFWETLKQCVGLKYPHTFQEGNGNIRQENDNFQAKSSIVCQENYQQVARLLRS
jgi:hypothetical protein